jgi:molecular chaperone HtpG
MTTGKLQIHSENILPIIKKWLYSDKDIFLRELVSNACDAMQKVKVLRDAGECSAQDDEFRIEIVANAEEGTVTITDTGIGMDRDEVERYIAQLAFSGAEEFVEKYQSQKEGEQIIGHFGLGFYSAYMVAETVEIDTLSYREGAQPALWSCDGSSEYTLGEGGRQTRGTKITLHIAKEEEEYLDEERLRSILNHYCAFLPYPIYLNGIHLNEKKPLWLKPAAECTDQEYLDFYRQLYPTGEDPLFWVHLSVDYPFNLKGILYFPKVSRNFNFDKNTIKLFCNRVFVSDNCKDLIPDYLMILQGAIDSPDIPLNVSRSYLQMDRTVRQLSGHISKKVSDRLVSFYQDHRDRFIESWPDLEVIVKLGAIQDEKFYERVKGCLIWKNLDGEWTTLDDYLERNKEKHDNRVFYSPDERHRPHFLDLYRQKGIEVLFTHPAIDLHLIAFLERQRSGLSFCRIDGRIDDLLLDKDREKSILDAEGKTEATRLADLLRTALEIEGLQVVAKSLASDALPGFVMMDEQARRMRDMLVMSDIEQGEKGLEGVMSGRKTFVANTNSPLMHSLQRLYGRNPALAKNLARQVYDLALLSQRELRPEAMDTFIERNQAVLQQLAAAAALSS